MISSNHDPSQSNHCRRLVRRVFSYAPRLGLVQQPDRPAGISVFIRVRDEVDWIAMAIQSLQSFADEIIVVDNGSTDGTQTVVRAASTASAVPVQLHERPDLNYTDVSNFALEQATFGWAFNWDGDFVGHTSGATALSVLRHRLLSLDRRRHFLVHLRLINLAGDLEHQDRRAMVHFQEYVHTRCAAAMFVHESTFEAIRVPKYYDSLFWYEPYVYHVNIKPVGRLFLRQFWDEWLGGKDFEQFPHVEDFARQHFADRYGTDSWEQAQRMFFQQFGEHLVPYDRRTFGDLPDLLQAATANPAYRLVEENGRVVGRNDLDG